MSPSLSKWDCVVCNLLQLVFWDQSVCRTATLHLCIFFNDELTPHFIKIMSNQMSEALCGNQMSTTADPTWCKVIHQRVGNSKSTHPSGTNLCSICTIPREDMWEAPPSPRLFWRHLNMKSEPTFVTHKTDRMNNPPPLPP